MKLIVSVISRTLLLSRLFDCHGLASRIATKRLVKQIKYISPDIIHLHNIHGYYINYKILFDYLNKVHIPIVWTMHDCWAFTGHCAHFVPVNCMRWKDRECDKCPLLKQYPKSYTDHSKFNLRLKQNVFAAHPKNIHIIAVSKWLQDFVRQSFLKDCNITTIYNGVDLQLFNMNVSITKPLGIDKNEKIILGVSSIWNNNKGLQDFKRLRYLLPPDVKIILIGLNPEQIRDLPKGILGIERTQNATELSNYYTIANVFVNPTYADSFPTVNLEAMACGTPVITYRTGGSPEAVTPETGIVVKQGNIDDLYDAINIVLRNGKDYYKQACRKRVEEYFDKDKCFMQYIDLYNEILNTKK